jgi:RHS repeat-associated protein
MSRCPEGLQVNSEYDAYGNLIQVSAGTWPTWTLMSASGSSTSSLLNGFMVATATHNFRGMLTNLKTVSAPDILLGATTLRNMDFVFNETTGNLTSRTGMIPQKETFYYDNLDRLTDVKHGSPETSAMTMGYSNKGNISSKTGLGTYRYNASKVHALEEVDNTDGLIPGGDQAITYNAFNRVSQITETAGDETRQLDITYGPDGQRWKTELRKNGSVAKTVIYAGNYERVIKSDTTTHLYYMEGGGIHVRQVKGASTLLREGRYYIHPDHLGSLTLITDATGGTVQKCSFDAWGKRTFITKTPSLVFDRGFTGHEHLDEFGLINMNGRMYDPIVGRFLSPDLFVQDPEFSQSYNRYSYALNNPLIYTDPSGEIVWFVPVIIGAAMGAYSGYKIADAKGYSFKDGSMYGHILGGAVIGGLAGFAGVAVGASALAGGSTAMQSAIIGGMVGGMLSGGINGAGMTALAGGSFSDVLGGMVQGAVTGGFAGAAGAAAFQGMNNLLDKTIAFNIGNTIIEGQPFKVLPTNTLSYVAGSTASQMAANLVNGRNPFKGVDYGINLGILFPLTVDALTYSQKFNMNMARKRYAKSSDITGIGNSQTTVMPNGDLRLDQNLHIQEYFPDDLTMEVHNRLNRLDLSTPHPLAGQPRVIIDYWVHSTFIPNYQWQIFSIFNSLSIKRK